VYTKPAAVYENGRDDTVKNQNALSS